jgi:hypothetical protein
MRPGKASALDAYPRASLAGAPANIGAQDRSENRCAAWHKPFTKLTEKGSLAFEATVPILARLPKAETAERQVRSMAYQLKARRFRVRLIS